MAEQAGYVEYHLPPDTAWQVLIEYPTKGEVESNTIIYVPEGFSKESCPDIFMSSVSDQFIDLDEISLGNIEVDGRNLNVLAILDRDSHSVLYEWSMMAFGNQVMAHALTRLFSREEGTVMLTYVTYDSDNQNKLKTSWLQSLKDVVEK